MITIQSDVWPFSKKNKDDTVKQDSAPASSDSSVNRLEVKAAALQLLCM